MNFPPPGVIWRIIQKLIPFFFLKWTWRKKIVRLFNIQSLSKVLPSVILPLNSVNSGSTLLSKNLKNAITQRAIRFLKNCFLNHFYYIKWY